MRRDRRHRIIVIDNFDVGDGSFLGCRAYTAIIRPASLEAAVLVPGVLEISRLLPILDFSQLLMLLFRRWRLGPGSGLHTVRDVALSRQIIESAHAVRALLCLGEA